MITEDYISFETAKLLKEKGFDEFTRFQQLTIIHGRLIKLLEQLKK